MLEISLIMMRKKKKLNKWQTLPERLLSYHYIIILVNLNERVFFLSYDYY